MKTTKMHSIEQFHPQVCADSGAKVVNIGITADPGPWTNLDLKLTPLQVIVSPTNLYGENAKH